MTGAGFPHSEILESQPGCRLLEAYRRLQRPSSAPGAKTSTVCSYKLDTACTTCKLLEIGSRQRQGSSPEDARVHCVVLKIRTEPCIADLHPETRDDRPFEVLALSEAAASSGPNSVLDTPASVLLVPQLPQREVRTNRITVRRGTE